MRHRPAGCSPAFQDSFYRSCGQQSSRGSVRLTGFDPPMEAMYLMKWICSCQCSCNIGAPEKPSGGTLSPLVTENGIFTTPFPQFFHFLPVPLHPEFFSSLFFLIWIALFSILFLSVFSSFFHFFLIEWLFLFFHRGENNIIPKPVSLLHLLHKKSTGRS